MLFMAATEVYFIENIRQLLDYLCGLLTAKFVLFKSKSEMCAKKDRSHDCLNFRRLIKKKKHFRSCKLPYKNIWYMFITKYEDLKLISIRHSTKKMMQKRESLNNVRQYPNTSKILTVRKCHAFCLVLLHMTQIPYADCARIQFTCELAIISRPSESMSLISSSIHLDVILSACGITSK